MTETSLQDRFAPGNSCFGCGPSNENGLKLKSFVDGDYLIAQFEPLEYHQAFAGILNGGIIGTLLDCQCNWTAAWHLMKRSESDRPPCTVTAEYKIELKMPTAIDRPVQLKSWIDNSSDRRANVIGELYSLGQLKAVCHGLFVSVKPGHPAYHGWS